MVLPLRPLVPGLDTEGVGPLDAFNSLEVLSCDLLPLGINAAGRPRGGLVRPDPKGRAAGVLCKNSPALSSARDAAELNPL